MKDNDMTTVPQQTTQNLPTITQDSYKLDEQFLKMAQKFFFKDSNEKELELSTLKTSFFGNVIQMASLITRNGVFHRNALYDEFFLNTATMDSSVYQFAKLYNYSINDATPSKCFVTFALKTDEIDAALDNLESLTTASSLEQNVRVLTINKATKFYFDDLQFMLPNSILITRSGSGSLLSNDFNYIATWDTEDFNLSKFSQTTADISSTVQVVGDDKYLVMKVVLYQMEAFQQDFQCTVQDSSQSIFFQADIENNLAGFEVYVDADGVTSNVIDNEFFRVEHLFNDTTQGSGHAKYCYYSYPSESSLEIFFNPYPEYRPAYGATIRVKYFSTRGASGNVSFTGQITAEVDIMPKDQIVPQVYAFDPVITCLTDPSNGKDRPTMKEIKLGIIELLLLREGRVTDTDLQIYFNEVSQMTFSGLSRNLIRFIKKTDDALRRVYNAYLMMQDNDNYVIPTNTIDLKITAGDLESNNFRLKKGTSIMYDSAIAEYRLLNADEYPEDFIYEKKSIVYSLPYLIKIQFENFLRCVYYRTDKSEVISAKLLYNNNLSTFSHIINTLNVYRNSMFEDTYKIYFNLNSSVEDVADQTMLNGNYAETGAYAGFRVFLVFEENTEASAPIYCIEMKAPASGTKTWMAALVTNDIIREDGYMELMYTQNGTDVNFALPEQFRMKVLVCYDERAIIDGPLFSVRKTTDSVYKRYASFVPEGYALMSVHTHDNNGYISLHTSLTSICFSEIKVEDSNYFRIREIPVIGTKYLLDSDVNKTISEALKNIEEVFLTNAESLENNTQLNLKFYNTFGAAKLYDSDYVNLFIKLRISINTSYSLTLDDRIKEAIIKFVNDANSIGRLSLSNLVRELETSFTEIKYIDVVGINDMGVQTVTDKYFNNTDAMTKGAFREYVPEYLNVNMQLEDGILTHSIEIEYV